MHIEAAITTVLKSRQSNTDMVNVVEILGCNQSDFQEAFDIALEMENRNLVKLLYSNFNAGKIIVEFTLVGKNQKI